MKKLHNAAYDIFVREYGVGNSKEYSKFEDIVKSVDRLGKDLLLSGPDSMLYLTPQERAEAVKRHIGYIISVMIAFAN